MQTQQWGAGGGGGRGGGAEWEVRIDMYVLLCVKSMWEAAL